MKLHAAEHIRIADVEGKVVNLEGTTVGKYL